MNKVIIAQIAVLAGGGFLLFKIYRSAMLRPAKKEELQHQVFVKHQLPCFYEPIERINREDGCKVYFADGSWIICRFSGTEPLLRIAAEGNTPQQT